jgi:hypothetical protein
MGSAPEEYPRRGQSVYAQTVGALAGMGLVLGLVYLFPGLLNVAPLGVLFLWGAVLGAGIADYRQFERTGAMITRQQRPVLNYLVGAGLPLLVLVLATIWLAAGS